MPALHHEYAHQKETGFCTAELWKTTYTESTFWFDIHVTVFAVSLIASAALVGVVFWKVSLMKEEQKLIEAGRKAA